MIVKVPFVDLKAQYDQIKSEVDEKISWILENTAVSLGQDLRDFEEEFAVFCNEKYSVGVSSGTDALIIALRTLNIGPGDEVITVSNTFIATAEAISLAGAVPVFVDINNDDFNIDTSLIEDKINEKKKAIIPVHLFGQPANMEKISDIAVKHGLFIIEDACQAHGAEFIGKKVGTLGNIGAFSFYPGKNLGAYGDGGAVVTNNEELYRKMLSMRSHGEVEKGRHDIIGSTNRLDNLQAAILRVKLKYLESWNESRRNNAMLYRKYLEDLELELPEEIEDRKHVYHLYVVKVKNRDMVREKLFERGIATGIHYPVPIHLQPAYGFLGYKKGDLPVAEETSDSVLSLPMFPELTEEQIKHIRSSLIEVLG
ncbi:MAG: DegT/DnrJ/EryC1/StrS family aminotransferase [Actinobacteria bacterium]|nr:DegT/DnrJ/EryC1/StrS family aminotransferase [Actinomycetota bacterium]